MNRLDKLLQQLSQSDEEITSLVKCQVSNTDNDELPSNKPAFNVQEMNQYFFSGNEESRKKLFRIFEENKEAFLSCQQYGEETMSEIKEKVTLERTKKIIQENLFSVEDLVK